MNITRVSNKSYINGDTYVKYEKESGKLRMSGGSWTINLDKINLDKVKIIRYITEKYNYQIKTDDATGKGYIRNFRGENKLVVPIAEWTKEVK